MLHEPHNNTAFPRRALLPACFAAPLVLLLVSCHLDMYDQPRNEVWEESSVQPWSDSRRPVPGTVARGKLELDGHLYRGRVDGRVVDSFPFAVEARDLNRGEELFNAFCSGCHGRVGDGRGMVVRRGFNRPPSLHIERLREEEPLGHFFEVISHGYKTMPAFAGRISAEDRWRVIAYLRALQKSQHIALQDAPEDIRAQFENDDESE